MIPSRTQFVAPRCGDTAGRLLAQLYDEDDLKPLLSKHKAAATARTKVRVRGEPEDPLSCLDLARIEVALYEAGLPYPVGARRRRRQNGDNDDGDDSPTIQ